MKAVEIYVEDTKDFKVEGSIRHGEDLIICHPYEDLFREVYRNYENTGTNTWKEEFELEVKNKVWCEEERWGGALEYNSVTYYMHKDVLNRKMEVKELSFLNAYRDRFLLINENATLYLYDGYTQKKYKLESESTDFKNFKSELKKLKLI